MKNWANTRIAGAAIILALGAVALTACGGDAAATKSNADLLKEAAANMKTAKSYQLDANVDQAGQAVKLNGMLDVANNNTQMTIEASGQNIAVVTVGSDVYLSTDGGKTYSKAGAEGEQITSGFGSFTKMWDSFQPDQVDKAKDALKDGTPATEKIDGVDTRHITANAKDLSLLGGASSTATDGTLDLWISTDAKPYVRQMKIDGTSGGQPIKGTLTWTKFDEKFDIKAPPTAFKLNILTTASR